ncbi:hypothetical protein BH18ACT8_BH18ACT8_14900 [soil metagenome]
MVTTIAETLAIKGEELEAALARISAPTGDQGGISFGKRVGEGTSMAVDRISLVAAHERLQVMLADVRRAQAKLIEGDYGKCDRCRAGIPPERMEALPWATLCVGCAGRR